MKAPADPAPESDTPRLVAVYATDEVAGVLRALAETHDIHPRVDDGRDVVDELRAEMAEELGGSLAGPGVPTMNKEILRPALVATAIGGMIGGILMAPVAILEWGGLSLPYRLFWTAFIGVVAGSTVGVLLGGALGARAANRPPAAQRGTTLSLPDTPGVVDVLAAHDPIRIDRIHPDGHAEALLTEADLHDHLESERLSRNAAGSDRGDEY